jgi:hypothetical protein
MRRLNVLTWNTHASYLHYLSQAPHEFFVLSKPRRPPGYGGRSGHIPWNDNVHDLPVEAAPDMQFDCILFQDDHQWEKDQYEYLTAAQRALPRIYLEHSPPRAHPTDAAHLVDDPGVLLVHVTPFNELMWNNGRTPTRVIEYGVPAPGGVGYRGDLERGLVIANHLHHRGRYMGTDLFLQVRTQLPLELVGMSAEELDGLGEIGHGQLPAFASRYRFLFSPVRYSGLGLSLIEAMMVGMPIVALATSEMATVIENGVSGYVDTNLATLAERMRLLLREPGLARQLGEGAWRRARERFSSERFVADWNQALRDVTS